MKNKKNPPKTKQKISPYAIALIIIILIGTFLRFAFAPDIYSFDDDGIRDAIVAHEGAKNFSFPLTGPFSSTGPYTFGPWYYICMILFSIILPIPYAPWILMGIISLITILLMSDIGRLLHSKKLGIILATIAAIAPTQISDATGLSNINPVTFFATLSIWITFKLLKKESKHYLWYLILGLSLGMGINAHYQMAGLLWLPILLWLFTGWKKIYIPLLIALGIFITFIPLLIFNLQTNWSTLNGINEMYIAKERMYVPNSWKIYLFDFWPSHLQFILFSPLVINITLIILLAIVLLKDLLTKKYSIGIIILLIILFLNFLELRYYWGVRNDVYLSYLEPIIFILLGYTLISLWQTKYTKIPITLLATILTWNFLFADYDRIKNIQNKESNLWKKEAQMLQEKYPNHNITLYSCNEFYKPHKKTLAYFIDFNYPPNLKEKKIAMKESGCLYPNINGYDFKDHRIKEKYGKQIYPYVIPENKDSNFNFIDISIATPGAIKKAGWKPVTTKNIFNDTVNWWKRH